MSTTPSPDRRFIVALTAAVASVTLAIGATTAALLGWVGPSAEPSAPTPPAAAGSGSAQLVDVPITPAAPPPRPSIEPVHRERAPVDHRGSQRAFRSQRAFQ